MTHRRWGAIFDWDGVVIDSSAAHQKSWDLLAAAERRTLPIGFFKKSFGMKNQKIIPELLHWTSEAAEIQRLGDRKEELYREIIRKERITQIPGTREFLERLGTAGVPCAVGSSTPRPNIELALELIGERQFFRVIVAADDVTHGKPAPDVFLLAAKHLGIPPARCVVLEDAHVGIEAAHAGGMKVVGVASTHPAATLRGADRVVHRLDELSLAELAELIG